MTFLFLIRLKFLVLKIQYGKIDDNHSFCRGGIAMFVIRLLSEHTSCIIVKNKAMTIMSATAESHSQADLNKGLAVILKLNPNGQRWM